MNIYHKNKLVCLEICFINFHLFTQFFILIELDNRKKNLFVNENPYSNKKMNRKNNYSNQSVLEEGELDLEAVELPKGYYVLNKKATKLSGVPKYVYLGPEQPTD